YRLWRPAAAVHLRGAASPAARHRGDYRRGGDAAVGTPGYRADDGCGRLDTLVFFIGPFIVIGAGGGGGLISVPAGAVGRLVAGNLPLAMLAVVWLAAIISGIVDNVPFTAAMLPVVAHLSAIIPGAGNNMLFYALAVGAAMGGNTTLIGASANLVTAGISDRAGYPITFKRFLAIGLPSVLVTTTLGTSWLFIHFC